MTTTVDKDWVYRNTSNLRRRGYELDDLQQEAQIAVWRNPKALPSTAAWRRMTDLGQGRSFLGSEHPGSKARAADMRPPFSIEADLELFESMTEPVEVDFLAGVEAEEILAAIKTLNPRDQELVIRKFYLDESWETVGHYFGTGKTGAQKAFAVRIAPILREALTS